MQHPKSAFHLFYLLYTLEGLASLSDMLNHIFMKMQGLGTACGFVQFLEIL